MKLHRLGLGILASSMLAACSDSAPPPTFSDIRFVNGTPIRLNVAAIDLKAEFQPSFRAPEIEQDFPVPPQRAVENWVHDRLRAGNPQSEYRARVTILDAAAHDHPDGETYDAKVSVRIDILDGHGFPVRSAHAEASRSTTLESGASLDDKDLAWYGMTRQLVGSLGTELERQIRNSFYPYVM